jgi:hypothetical protein
MIAPEKVSLSDFVSRRLHPTKVTLAYIRHEMAVHSNATVTQIDRQELASVLATLELFIEDYEKLVTRGPGASAAMPAMAAAERTSAYVADARA